MGHIYHIHPCIYAHAYEVIVPKKHACAHCTLVTHVIDPGWMNTAGTPSVLRIIRINIIFCIIWGVLSVKILFPSYQYLHVHVHTYMRVRGFVQLYWSLCNLYYTACSVVVSVPAMGSIQYVLVWLCLQFVRIHMRATLHLIYYRSIDPLTHSYICRGRGPGSRARARVRVILICLIRTV